MAAKAHLVSGGIASLAAAVYLLRSAGLLGPNIHVCEASDAPGGALDAAGDPASGYGMRGGRMFEANEPCIRELFSLIPSRDDPMVSIEEELQSFHRERSWLDKARLVGSGGVVVPSDELGLGARHALDLAALLATPESRLDGPPAPRWRG